MALTRGILAADERRHARQATRSGDRVCTGVPTSLNPIQAVLQGVREDPPYREEVTPIRGRICSDCGRVEFFIDSEDLARITQLTGSAETG